MIVCACCTDRETADSQEVGRALRSLQPAFLGVCDNGFNESGRLYGLEARIQDRSNSSVHPGAELLRAVATISSYRFMGNHHVII